MQLIPEVMCFKITLEWWLLACFIKWPAIKADNAENHLRMVPVCNQLLRRMGIIQTNSYGWSLPVRVAI